MSCWKKNLYELFQVRKVDIDVFDGGSPTTWAIPDIENPLGFWLKRCPDLLGASLAFLSGVWEVITLTSYPYNSPSSIYLSPQK